MRGEKDEIEECGAVGKTYHGDTEARRKPSAYRGLTRINADWGMGYFVDDHSVDDQRGLMVDEVDGRRARRVAVSQRGDRNTESQRNLAIFLIRVDPCSSAVSCGFLEIGNKVAAIGKSAKQ